MQDPLEWVERARLRWPLNLYKATRRRRSLDDCVHDAFRTVWIFACRRLWEPHLHGCIRLNAVHNRSHRDRRSLIAGGERYRE